MTTDYSSTINQVPPLNHDLYVQKPREEKDLSELYPDLGESSQLPVFFIGLSKNNEVKETSSSVGGNSTVASSGRPILNLKAPVFKKIQPTIPNPNIKFNKQLLDYGFREPSKNSDRCGRDTYIRQFEIPTSIVKQSDQIDHESTIKQYLNKRQLLVEYDMDEQDTLYLQDRNKQTKNVIKITPEVFETMISTLEDEWSKLEHRMNMLTNNDGQNGGLGPNDRLLTMGHNNLKYGNDDGIEPGSIYDQRCAVCNDSDCDNSNAIVFCDGCDIAVHQECYGVAFIPEGQWLCRKCMINKSKVTECVFCPSTTGAFKQLDNSLWGHVICGLWINELYFANPVYMEPIEGMESIPKSRWKLTCYICRQRVGACIQCTNRSCFQAYHVTCAKRAGLHMEMTQGVKGALTNKLTLRSYCDKHTPPSELDRLPSILEGIEKTRLYYTDTKLLNQQNAKLSSDQKVANKLNIFKWKTESNTPIAPKIFSDKLVELMYSLKVENQVNLPEESMNQVLELSVLPNRTKEEIRSDLTSIANEICRYWCLKRELKNGAPLVRKNNDFGTLGTGSGSGSTMSGSLLYDFNNLESNGPNESQINEKIKFANVLVQDLSRLILMNEFNTQRQVVAKEIDDMAFSIADMYYFPLSQVIKLSIEKLNSKYDPGHVILNYVPKTTTKDINCCKSLKAMMRHNERNGYENIQQFKSDVDVLAATIWKENKPSSNVCKKMKVWKREFDKEIARIAVNDDEGSNELVPMSKLSANGLEVTAENIGDENLSGYVDDGGQNTGMVNTLSLEDVEMSDLSDIEYDGTSEAQLQEFLNT
ncbi:PHD-zinc-finger like domain family protein [Candida parapsilosis]|uniref:PHD-type domain-containing protein n=2 Tax=Candida parapsilosis TaxID=5480 RepID=G8BAH8_CANPC|nr:uncharacterized protein CPAR2_806000 [Candida parapsilosis]KAF6051949.1 PHD-zinc-finger like domain family protein [Candida parapsilosis]KAF6052554.1 PHD-zinc-finger like domain family protein [Candida parapsilosis]KAF6053751.1 PHD-zinc-finger like domain family protein [Candida parapsilosis]KAF6064330.1 PHD-zinc-finger like domain family protein [Candida parapsilosis]KAI5904698.1 NuA3 HAT complex component NTO1 [Candida parapsilosis]